MRAATAGGSRLPCFGVVGPSGVGKTTLLESLVPALRRRGLAVGAVKHASHGFLADRPGKDSHRIYESGAAAVALVSHEQVATFVRRPAGERTDPDLSVALEGLPGALDLVVVEGFSWEPIPRVILVPASSSPQSLDRYACGEVLRVWQVPPHPPREKPHFEERDVEALVDILLSRVRATRPSAWGATRPGGAWRADA